MQIICESCQTKYSISDDKVRGKVIKIRCKKCPNTIIVKGPDGTAEGGMITRGIDDMDIIEDSANVWHVAINGRQAGPFSADTVKQKLRAGEINGETYLWKEGFSDWLTLSKVPEFSSSNVRATAGQIELLSSPANTLNNSVFIGKAFAFISPKLVARPDLAWLVSIFGAEVATPRVIPLLEEVVLPGVKARGDLDFVRHHATTIQAYGGTPIHGVFLQQGASPQSPFEVEHLEENRARITPTQEVSGLCIVALDRDFPMKRANAVDPSTAEHPQTTDRLYQTAEKFFEQGQISMAKALYEEARGAFPVPHPFYAYNIACCAARLGDKDEAVRWLKTSISDGWLDLNHLKNDSDLASLHGYTPFDTLGGNSQAHTTSTAEIQLFPSTLLLIGAFVGDIPWEAWLVL